MKILITGSGGFIGSHLVDHCKSAGHYVVGIDRKPPEEWVRGERRCDWEVIADIAGLLPSIQRFDICYHLAADSRIQPSFDDPIGYVMDNIVGTANVLQLCRTCGARMVYAGSSTADDDTAKNVYATTKRSGEMLCQAWGRCFDLSVSIARFYNVYGPRQIESGELATVIGIFERQWRNGEQLTVTGDGSQRRDFTFVGDIVDGLVTIANRGSGDSKIYPLGTGVNYSLLEIARMFVDDGRIRFIPRPPGEAEVTLAKVGETMYAIGWSATQRLEEYIAEVIYAGAEEAA